ncbi:MAG: hypothetical protein ACM31C_27150 [Acidobacteriota bacterium]
MKRTQVQKQLKVRRKEIKTLQAPQLQSVTGGKGSWGGGTFGGGGSYSNGGGGSSKYCGTW